MKITRSAGSVINTEWNSDGNVLRKMVRALASCASDALGAFENLEKLGPRPFVSATQTLSSCSPNFIRNFSLVPSKQLGWLGAAWLPISGVNTDGRPPPSAILREEVKKLGRRREPKEDDLGRGFRNSIDARSA